MDGIDCTRPSAIGRQRLVFDDASEAAEAQGWLSKPTYRQLSPGRFSGALERLRLGEIEVGYEHHCRDVHKIGAMPAGQCTLSFVDSVRSNARFSQFAQGESERLFLLPEHTAFDILVPGGCAVSYVRLDQADLLQGLATLNEPLASRLAAGGDLQALGVDGKISVERSLRALAAIDSDERNGALIADTRVSAALRHSFRTQLLHALSITDEMLSGTAPSLHARRRAVHIVSRARDYMAAKAHQGITPDILGVCEHVGVSERTLQYAFKSQLSLSPAAYLRLVRLNGVRAELSSPSSPTTSVTSVAIRWGFMHFSRFARAYRQLFSESPSATLARAMRA